VLLVAVSLQTVWWSPLNVDEELTLRIADFSFGNVFHIVSTKRGGGPLHFWLEHFLQGWWPGLESLRFPSIVFACLALPAVALIARELIGERGAAGVVLLTAVAPIPVLYTTFGRPHTMLFAWLRPLRKRMAKPSLASCGATSCHRMKWRRFRWDT